MDRLLRVSEVARLLSVSRTSVYAWIAQDLIPHTTLPGGSMRIPAAALERWQAERTIMPRRLRALETAS